MTTVDELAAGIGRVHLAPIYVKELLKGYFLRMIGDFHHLDMQDRKSFRERYLKPALVDGLIEMTIPDKPNSRLQKYRLTDKGQQWLHERVDEKGKQ